MSTGYRFYRLTRPQWGIAAMQVGVYDPSAPIKAVEFSRVDDSPYFVSLLCVSEDKTGLFERVHEEDGQ